MNKYFKCVCALLIAAVLVVGLVGCIAQPTPTPTPVEVEAVGLSTRPHVPYGTHYSAWADADRFVILVDLDGVSNFPHAATGSIVLKALRVSGNLSDAVNWKWKVGVVVTSTTDGVGIEWIASAPIFRSMFFDERWEQPEHGISLLVASDSLVFIDTNEVLSTATITSGTTISAAHTSLSGTASPAVGDLILFTDEISDTATLNITVDTSYETEH